MAKQVMRYNLAEYLDVGNTETPNIVLMNAGFNSLTENSSPNVVKTAYIGDKNSSVTITGYENSFPYETDFISDELAVKFLYDIARNQKTGSDAETYFYRVDLFGTPTGDAYPARKFKVAVEASGSAGASKEKITASGTLHQIGDYTDGTFDIVLKTFTPTVEE